MEDSTRIQLRQVSYTYEEADTPALSDVSAEIREGEFVAVLGHNGSGKSTLMKTILGIRAPMGGTLTFGDGLEKNQIGYLPQQTLIQRDFPASVREIVRSGFQGKSGLRPFYTKEEKRMADEHMKQLGLAGAQRPGGHYRHDDLP